MELILALLVPGPLGYLMPDRRVGLAAYLAAWAVVLPVVQVVIVSLGLGLNHVGRTFRERRLAAAR